MKIKQIFDEIAAESGNNAKIALLKKYADNKLLERVLYMTDSKRVKFYIKRIPEYNTLTSDFISLEDAIDKLSNISNRYVTGNEALNFLQEILSNLAPDDAYIIERIIEKDPKIGMGTTFINKVFKGLIEETPYMGAIAFNEKKARKIFEGGAHGVSQVKMDGRYCNAIIRNGEVELESRQGEPTIVTGATFLEELTQFPNCVLNGELTMDGIPRYESNGIIASIIDICGKKHSRSDIENAKKLEKFTQKHGDFDEALSKIRYTVWDMITIDEYFDAKSAVPYINRMMLLATMLQSVNITRISQVESQIVDSYEDAIAHFREVLGRGDEGTILKSINGEWKDGKPNHQIKMKLEMALDLVITGFNYGTKGTKNENVISSFNAETSCGKLKTRPQGLTESLMEEITENQDKLLGTVIEIKCCGLSQDQSGAYSVLYPAFKHFRDDKSEANTLDECIEIQNAAIGLTIY
jgi:DNA ligase-1